jgi:hypothetical protein
MDIVIEKMKQLGVPLTRKNYLDFAYFGTPPETLSAEEEATIPKGLTEEPETANIPAADLANT